MIRIPGHQQKTFDTPIQIILAGLTGLMIGLMTVYLDINWILLIVFGMLLVLLSIHRPEIAVLTIVVFLSTIIPESRIPIINIGPGRLYVTELIFLLLVVIFLVRWLTLPTQKIQHTPLDFPLLAFIFTALISTIWALLHQNVQLQHAIPELRIIFYYLLFFLVVNLAPGEKSIKFLLRGINFLATIVATVMILQFVLGRSFPILEGRIELLSGSSGITRITDTPGESLITIVVMINLIRFVSGKFRLVGIFELIQLGMFITALIMTFNRTHWVMVIASLILAVILANWKDREKIFYWGMIIFFFIIVLVAYAYINPQSTFGNYLTSSIDRGLTVFQIDSYTENDQSTLRWRDFEYKYGLPQIAKKPILGLGLGAIYRPVLYDIDHENFYGQVYTHNGNLWLAMKTGLLGYGFFLIFILTFIWRGFHYWRTIKDTNLRSTLLGITLAMVMVLIGANIHPFFMTLFWTPLLGIIIGIGENIIRTEKITD